MARILVNRAMPEAEETARDLEARGHQVILAPLRVCLPVDQPAPQGLPAALIATSRNAFAGKALPEEWYRLPLFCVGNRTAEIARAAGFGEVIAASGDAEALAALIVARMPPPASLVYLAGEPRGTTLEMRLAEVGHVMRIWERYRMKRLPTLPDSARGALAEGRCDALLHFSAESARVFFALAAEAGLEAAARRPVHACLSNAVADAARLAAGKPLRIIVAENPSADAMIASLDRIEA